jgi:hypothetical protein
MQEIGTDTPAADKPVAPDANAPAASPWPTQKTDPNHTVTNNPAAGTRTSRSRLKPTSPPPPGPTSDEDIRKWRTDRAKHAQNASSSDGKRRQAIDRAQTAQDPAEKEAAQKDANLHGNRL